MIQKVYTTLHELGWNMKCSDIAKAAKKYNVNILRKPYIPVSKVRVNDIEKLRLAANRYSLDRLMSKKTNDIKCRIAKCEKSIKRYNIMLKDLKQKKKEI